MKTPVLLVVVLMKSVLVMIKLTLLIAVLFMYGCATKSTKMETKYLDLVQEYASEEYHQYVKEIISPLKVLDKQDIETKKEKVVRYYKKCMKKRNIDTYKQFELLTQQEMVLVNYIQALKDDNNIPKAKEALEDNFKSAIKRNEKEE